MTKILDIFLIGALCLNLFNTYNNYTPKTEVLGTTINTGVAIALQVICIGLIGYKLYRNYAKNK